MVKFFFWRWLIGGPSFPAATCNELRVAWQRVQQALKHVGQMLMTDQNLVEDLAVMFQAAPLAAETSFRDEVWGMCRTIIGKAFDTFHDYRPPLEVRRRDTEKGLFILFRLHQHLVVMDIFSTTFCIIQSFLNKVNKPLPKSRAFSRTGDDIFGSGRIQSVAFSSIEQPALYPKLSSWRDMEFE